MLMERAGTVQIRGAIEQTLGDCACCGNVTAKRSQNGKEIKGGEGLPAAELQAVGGEGVAYASRATWYSLLAVDSFTALAR